MNVDELELKALDVRRGVLDMIYHSKAGHIGGTFSSADIIVALYYKLMHTDPTDSGNPNRDRFILSKGHCIEGYLYTLADKGFFDREELKEFSTFGSRLIGHPNRAVPGIEMNTGSLGHGLSCACGMALAAKMDHKDYRVYALMGDGEQDEGSIWEAAMFAASYSLDNLYAILDRNSLQISGPTERVMRLEPLKAKWEAFGFHVMEINGNSMAEIVSAFDSLYKIKGKPKLLLANTVKGKGVSFMENQTEWHHNIPTAEQYIQAVRELDAARGVYQK